MDTVDLSAMGSVVDFRWDLLASEVPAPERLIARLAQPDSSCEVYIAVDATGNRSILVRIPAGEQDALAERISRGVRVQTLELKVDTARPNEVFVEIACLDHEGHQILDVIAAEIIDALHKGATIRRIRLIQGILVKWRKFWSDAPQKLLSKEKQIGLFGELWFLKEWLIPQLGIEKGVSMWRGPLGSRNDFEAEGLSIEVKTSSRADESHQVNGLEQLLALEGTTLFLFSLLIREEAGGAESLPSLVAELRETLKTEYEAQAQFEGMLAAADFQESDIEQYQKLRFRIRGQGLYRVEEGFPRLIPSSIVGGLVAGIHDIKYGLRLDVAKNWLVADNPKACGSLLKN
ncbi:PD-(D/E)XK motif protein [Diaphorobacter ruginosibacter]|uniref:PD-(D/E)XK motif protein n=1 Tax=Diaphorobacter ruginosibacter TaxID=1715720 RepID=A0A7G9RIY4_9BURK|nr:PD-(D/E)XK motif protein [Diaphorobacter ruginosibacter]QNN55559.1 PD-(D/E)XK motif protein [Diaphorobacter ruginosibacter]